MTNFNNTTLAIIGIIIIGILSTYIGNNELAAVALGGDSWMDFKNLHLH